VGLGGGETAVATEAGTGSGITRAAALAGADSNEVRTGLAGADEAGTLGLIHSRARCKMNCLGSFT